MILNFIFVYKGSFPHSCCILSCWRGGGGEEHCMAGQNRLRDRLELRWLAMVSNIFSTSASIDQIYLLNKSDTFSVSVFQ